MEGLDGLNDDNSASVKESAPGSESLHYSNGEGLPYDDEGSSSSARKELNGSNLTSDSAQMQFTSSAMHPKSIQTAYISSQEQREYHGNSRSRQYMAFSSQKQVEPSSLEDSMASFESMSSISISSLDDIFSKGKILYTDSDLYLPIDYSDTVSSVFGLRFLSDFLLKYYFRRAGALFLILLIFCLCFMFGGLIEKNATFELLTFVSYGLGFTYPFFILLVMQSTSAKLTFAHFESMFLLFNAVVSILCVGDMIGWSVLMCIGTVLYIICYWAIIFMDSWQISFSHIDNLFRQLSGLMANDIVPSAHYQKRRQSLIQKFSSMRRRSSVNPTHVRSMEPRRSLSDPAGERRGSIDMIDSFISSPKYTLQAAKLFYTKLVYHQKGLSKMNTFLDALIFMTKLIGFRSIVIFLFGCAVPVIINILVISDEHKDESKLTKITILQTQISSYSILRACSINVFTFCFRRLVMSYLFPMKLHCVSRKITKIPLVESWKKFVLDENYQQKRHLLSGSKRLSYASPMQGYGRGRAGSRASAIANRLELVIDEHMPAPRPSLSMHQSLEFESAKSTEMIDLTKSKSNKASVSFKEEEDHQDGNPSSSQEVQNQNQSDAPVAQQKDSTVAIPARFRSDSIVTNKTGEVPDARITGNIANAENNPALKLYSSSRIGLIFTPGNPTHLHDQANSIIRYLLRSIDAGFIDSLVWRIVWTERIISPVTWFILVTEMTGLLRIPPNALIPLYSFSCFISAIKITTFMKDGIILALMSFESFFALTNALMAHVALADHASGGAHWYRSSGIVFSFFLAFKGVIIDAQPISLDNFNNNLRKLDYAIMNDKEYDEDLFVCVMKMSHLIRSKIIKNGPRNISWSQPDDLFEEPHKSDTIIDFLKRRWKLVRFFSYVSFTRILIAILHILLLFILVDGQFIDDPHHRVYQTFMGEFNTTGIIRAALFNILVIHFRRLWSQFQDPTRSICYERRIVKVPIVPALIETV